MCFVYNNKLTEGFIMISASALNSELINKIAQDFAQATGLAVVVVNIHGDEISELFNFTPFCQLMRQHPSIVHVVV